MMRMLAQVLMGTQGGGQSLFSTIKIAILPIAKVFTMCFLGFLMASKYVNILPTSGRKLLNGVILILILSFFFFFFSNSLISSSPAYLIGFCSLQLVFTLLLPCLIFSQLGQAITLQKMMEWSEFFSPVKTKVLMPQLHQSI